MEDVLISFATAKLAKEKGFLNPCIDWFKEDIPAPRFEFIKDLDAYKLNNWYLRPTQSLLAKWLRETHLIHIVVNRDEDMWKPEIYSFKEGNKHIPTGFKNYDLYEEALEASLLFALFIICT